jgi:hypothetical protein
MKPCDIMRTAELGITFLAELAKLLQSILFWLNYTIFAPNRHSRLSGGRLFAVAASRLWSQLLDF